MYINLETLEYPILLSTIREQNPMVSFPENPDKESLEAIGMAAIAIPNKPEYNMITQKIVQGIAIQNEYGDWFGTWDVVDKNIEEVLVEQKVIKRNYIKSAYELEMSTGTTQSSLGFPIDTSRTALEDINNLLNSMIITKIESISFRDANNEMHNISLADVHTIQQEALSKSMWAHAHKWQLESHLDSLNNVDDVLAIVW